MLDFGAYIASVLGGLFCRQTMQKYIVSYRCVHVSIHLRHVLEADYVQKQCKNTVYRIGGGFFGHTLGVSWEACFGTEPCTNTVYPIGVKLFGHVLKLSWEACSPNMQLKHNGFLPSFNASFLIPPWYKSVRAVSGLRRLGFWLGSAA